MNLLVGQKLNNKRFNKDFLRNILRFSLNNLKLFIIAPLFYLIMIICKQIIIHTSSI
ncbi:hypothetical protein psyc5s11_13010 [Clostridium gelidum]|uniref:Uncharacterized protein n=1 Tax=Clostridium gelidum TaxID=704125 RepID=A0ABM7T080_9CLOT|nr:hypothetical protein psyc5s11_13010 [Clostridium gelidum]